MDNNTDTTTSPISEEDQKDLNELAAISESLERLDRELEESHRRRMTQVDAIASEIETESKLIDEQLNELERDEAVANDVLDEVAMNEAIILARMEEEDELIAKADAMLLASQAAAAPAATTPGAQ